MNRRHKTYATLFAALTSAILLASCSTANPVRATREDPYPYWEKGAGAPEAAAFMKVQIPKGATEVKGAVQVNPQEDNYILTFRTDRTTASQVAADLRSEEPLEQWKVSRTPSFEYFRHFGLPEPETLKDAVHTGVCPPCVKDYRRRSVAWIEIYIENLASNQARVYLRAF
ncbi:hypothetical protein [Streptomyces sp. LMG1-1-1.1]|uniref:hypothetical protein n=1 Tax=Streptomyces sp. LMG1-1-1.1 TaxID=3135245 RepID=UPI003467D005